MDDAAEAIQVHALAITKWETAKVMPTPIQLRQLMLVYGCSAENLLFDENPWMLSPEQSAELTHVTRSASPSLRAKLDVYIAVHTIGVEPVWKSG